MKTVSNMQPTFLDLVETYSHHDASLDRLYGGEGRRMGGRHTMRKGQKPNPVYVKQVTEAARFLDGIKSGTIPMWRLQEAMSTSDFPNLFGDILDRQTLANYAEQSYSWQMYCKRSTVSDFRTVKRFRVDGAQGQLSPVAEREEYPEGKVTDGKYSYAVGKYGKRIPFTWETMVNDDLQALQDIPERLGRSARRTEEKFATTLFANNGTMFSSGNKNKVVMANGASVDDPILGISGLQDAMIVLANQTDTDGEPIAIESVVLVVPPALEITANNILAATQVWLNARGGSSTERLIVTNWMRGRCTVAVNYYLPIVDGTNGTTGWYLFANPNNGRPALEMGFLRGHETPEMFMKEPNARRIGGGGANPSDGDFDTDSLHYKIRHVFGGTTIDPIMACFSKGLN